jgi:hypothetical protein
MMRIPFKSRCLSKLTYRSIPLVPDFLRVARFARQAFGPQYFRVNPDDQNLFVIRSIEYPDLAALGQVSRRAPQKIVLELRGTRVLVTEDLAALGIDPGHHMGDCTVLAGGIHGLEDQQQRIAIRSVEHFLLALRSATSRLSKSA